MAETIRTYGPTTQEYQALRRVAEVLTIASKNRITYHVENVYFDFGQDWIWSTICAYRPDGRSWQILNPKIHADIVTGAMDAITAAARLIHGPSWLDK